MTSAIPRLRAARTVTPAGSGAKNGPYAPHYLKHGSSGAPKAQNAPEECQDAKKRDRPPKGRPLDDYAGKDLLLEVREVSLCEVGIITPAGILLEDTL